MGSAFWVRRSTALIGLCMAAVVAFSGCNLQSTPPPLPTLAQIATLTPSLTPTDVPTRIPTETPSPTVTATGAPTATPTETPSITPNPSETLTDTITPPPTLDVTFTPTDADAWESVRDALTAYVEDDTLPPDDPYFDPYFDS